MDQWDDLEEVHLLVVDNRIKEMEELRCVENIRTILLVKEGKENKRSNYKL